MRVWRLIPPLYLWGSTSTSLSAPFWLSSSPQYVQYSTECSAIMTTTRGPDIVNGTITNWLPFTTPGPVSSLSQCSSAIYYLPGAVSGFVAFDPYYGRWIDTAVKCLATEQTRWWEQHSDGITTNINLGPFACPTGYTTATVSSINPLTSFVGCCPS